MAAYCGAQSDQPKIVTWDEKGYNKTKNRDAWNSYASGIYELNNQNYQGGVISFNKAVDLDPKFVEAWDELGLCYRRLNDYSNAASCYQKSLSLNPNGYVAHLDLAYLYHRLNKKEEEIREYYYIQKIDPENPESYYGLAILFLDEGNYYDASRNALEAYQKYRNRGDSNCIDAEKLLSIIYSKQGQYDKAAVWRNQVTTDTINNK